MKKLNFILVFAFLVIAFGCNKDPRRNDTPANPNYITKTVSGIVVDENETPLADVDVNVNGNTTTTDQSGAFLLMNITVPKDSFLVQFKKDGYFENVRSGEPGSESNIRVRVGLVNKASATTTQFAADAGGTLSIGSGTLTTDVTFPDDLKYTDISGTPYTGTVVVTGYYVDPSAQNFSTLECATQIGRDSTHAKRHLSTYGALYMEVTDDQGGTLHLDPTSPSFPTISMAIPDSLRDRSAPSDIYVWSNNFRQSYSNSEGHGSKQGNNYMCQVRHFSYWQTAVPHTGFATILGKVTDSKGQPVVGVKVTIGQYYAVTNFIGKYKLDVPDNVSISVGVLSYDYYGQSSTLVTVGPYNDGQVDTVNITLPAMQTLSGNIVNCVGNNISGFVKFTFYDPQSLAYRAIQTFAKYGSYSFQVPLNVTSGTLTAYANGTSRTEYPNLDGAYGGTQDIQVCVVQLGPTELTISGGVYGSGSTFKDFPSLEGYYMTSSQQTQIQCYGNNTDMNIYFDGDTTGTFNIHGSGNVPLRSGSGDTAMVSLYVDTNEFEMNSGTLQVTKYGIVGSLIEGTFSGTGVIYGDTTNTQYNISGKFSVQRGTDQ